MSSTYAFTVLMWLSQDTSYSTAVAPESDVSSDDWMLVHRSTYGTKKSKETWLNGVNVDDPDAAAYSILYEVENYRGVDGNLEFKMVWPNWDGVINGVTKNNFQHWKQTSNPFHPDTSTGGVDGYRAIEIDHTSNYWGGLEYNTGDQSLADGSVDTWRWYVCMNFCLYVLCSIGITCKVFLYQN